MFKVTITYREQGTGAHHQYQINIPTERRARTFVRSEVKWEDTIRIEVPALGIDEQGDFARFYTIE